MSAYPAAVRSAAGHATAASPTAHAGERTEMPHRIWELLQEPKTVTATMGVAWIIGWLIGLVTLLLPPHSVHGVIGDVTIVMAVLLITGSSLGLAGCVSGWWWVERAGILGAGSGTAIYLLAIIALHFLEPGSRLTQAGFIILSGLLLVTRWFRIRGGQVDPTRGMDRAR